MLGSLQAFAPVAVQLPAQVIVLGAVTGLSYGLLGAGLTLIYRAGRTINFAHGQMGALAASLVPVLVIDRGVSVPVAVVLAIVAAGMTGLAVERFVIRKLAASSRLLVLVATLGLAQVLLVVEALIPRNSLAGKTYPSLVHATVEIGGVILSGGALQTLALAPIVVFAVDRYLRRSRLGLATRAAAENDEITRLSGVPVHRVTAATWVVAAALAAIAAILSGPSRPVVTTVAAGPGLMVRGLAAALLAGFGGLPAVLVGGVVVGVLEALVIWNVPQGGALEIVMLGVLLVTIALRRDLRHAARGGDESTFSLVGAGRPLPDDVARDRRVVIGRRALLAIALAAGVLVPLRLENADRFLLASTFVLAIAGLSLVVLTGMAGQVSLGQYAFVAVGAVVGGKLQALGYPWLTGLLYAVVAGAVVAVAVGLPALRVRGVFLAVTTLSFAVAASTWLFRQPWLINGPDGTSALHGRRPVVFGVRLTSELAYCWVCLAALVIVAVLVTRLRRTGVGRAIVAVRDNESAAAALTLHPAAVKLLAFALSGMIASAAGYLYGGLLGDFSTHPESVFAPGQSLALVGVVVVGGVASVGGVIAAAVWFRVLEHVLGPILSGTLSVQLYGLLTAGALLGAVLQFRTGIAGAMLAVRDRLLARLLRRPVRVVIDAAEAVVAPAPLAPAVTSGERNDEPALVATGIVLRYGGHTAIDAVDLTVRRGEVLALVGPNGAGKTSLFDVLSGRIRPDEGRVVLDGIDVTGLPPHERARLGVGRTFQQAKLFDDLTLWEAVAVALERGERSELVPSLLGLPPSRRAETRKRARAAELLERFGLDRFADRPVAELSTGTRRMAELVTQVAMAAPVVLLDEPTAGVAQREVEAFGPVLRALRDHLDATMVVIDHDLPLVRAVADRVVVLSAGSIVADGAYDDVVADPHVIAAFLGTDDAVIARSGPVAAR